MSRGREPVAPRRPVGALAFGRRFALEIGLALLVVVLFADYLFSDLLLYGSDSIPSGLFFRTLLVDFVREHGELPRWNPYILGGLPFLDATHGDTFFPSSVLHFLMPVYRALGHKLLLHIFLAGAFMAFYLRSLRLRPSAVAFGAVAYMLSPVFVSYLFTGQDGKMYVTSLAPLVFGLLERAMRGGRWATFVGLGLAIGFTILSAQIQMAYHCLWFLGALFLVRLVRGPAPAAEPAGGAAAATASAGSGRIRAVAGFAAALAIGLLVASIQLLPAVSYVKHPAGFSVRSDRTDYEHAASWSLHPEEVASILVPEFCNAPRGYWGRNYFKYNSDSVGIVALFLAALALRRRRDATRWFLAGLAVFAVTYSLGGHTPLHRLFYWVVPQVKLFRAPPLVMFGAAFGVAALAAHAVHDLVGEETSRSRRSATHLPRGLALALGAAGLLAVLGLAAGPVTELWNSVFQPPLDAAKAEIQARNLPDFRSGAITAGILLAAAVGLVEARRRGMLAVLPFAAALLVLTIVDEWRIDHRFRTLVEPDRWTEPGPLLRELAIASRQEKFRVAPAVASLANNELGVFGIESTFGFHDNELAWYRELRSAPEAQGLFLGDDRGYPFLRLLNVGYILHDRQELPNPLPVGGVLPRFRLVEDWIVEKDRSAIPGLIADPAFDVERTIVLEEDPGLVPGPEGAGAPGTVLSYSYDGNRIRVSVDARRPCLLVHAENWFPYWTAWQGAEELPILRADGTIRAIPLAAGNHELELRFRSAPYELGKTISLATLAACAIFLAAGRLVRRKAP